MARRTIEADVIVLGGGITAAMAAERLSEQSDVSIAVVEAGNEMFNLADRFDHRQRFLDYRENPWPDDHIPGQTGRGLQSRSMVLGGLAMHWGGTTPRFTPEDFRVKSMYGVGRDWPIDFEELDPFYQEAEERIGVAGVQGPGALDPRSKDYPMPPLPLSYNLEKLKAWAEKSDIPFWSNPVSKNSQPYRGRSTCVRCDTCTICPTGAKYSPDFTFRELLDQGKIELHTRLLVRKLELAAGSNRIERALATDRDAPDDTVELRARTFVLALGYAWSSHLLLLSASSRFPSGLANSSGAVGRYITGHKPVNCFVEVPMRLYPGIYEMDSLLSKRFQSPGKLDRYARFDLRIWETAYERQARLENDRGELLLGDDMMADWRERTATGTARLRAYYDVIPAPESRLVLDRKLTNRLGDPMFRIDFKDDPASVELEPHTQERIEQTFETIVRAGGGKILSISPAQLYDHPAGGCRMGDDPTSSVVDRYGRSHDHENLWIVGAPTAVSGGCNNGTLTFIALTLRTAAWLAEELPRRSRVESAVANPGVAA